MPIKKTAPRKNRFKKVYGLIATLAVVVVVLIVLELTHTIHLFHSQAVSGNIPTISTSSSKSTSSPSPSKRTSSNTSTTGSSTKDNTPPTASGTSSLPLVSPFGSFVSDHHPNLGGTPAPSSEQSVCNTTPGASCTITFTNSSAVVKSLTAQTANNNGSVYWTWDVKTAGFTVGNWQIKAMATLNGQSQSASDPTDLTVEP